MNIIINNRETNFSRQVRYKRSSLLPHIRYRTSHPGPSLIPCFLSNRCYTLIELGRQDMTFQRCSGVPIAVMFAY